MNAYKGGTWAMLRELERHCANNGEEFKVFHAEIHTGHFPFEGGPF